MTGTLLNTAAVVTGTLVGRLLGGRLPARMQEAQMAAVGLITVVLGVQNALAAQTPPVFLAALLALLVGGWIGEALRLHERIEVLGRIAEARLGGSGDASGRFARGFVTTSILFCAGPLTVLGCLEDGLRGDLTKLAVKSVLDGVSAAAFAASLGWGVLLSAGTVLVVQGALTLLAGLLRPLLTPPMIAAMTAAGGVLLLGLGLNLLGVTRMRVAAFLPALLLAPLFLRLLVVLRF